MKLGEVSVFKKAYDGGKDSGVTGYWLIEWKRVFSIVLLKFEPSHREAFHNHAFNALTWWIKGRCIEKVKEKDKVIDIKWCPSIIPKFTPRSNMHRIVPLGRVWALSIRGPWTKTWEEYHPGPRATFTLTKGRMIVNMRKL